MLPDAEIIKVTHEILKDLNIGKFKIKINNRKFLDAVVDICTNSTQSDDKRADFFKSICASIDKLDKESWTTV
jgi:histidyl-tRNA synthetase